MEPKDQVKIIMEVFVSLDHEEQVSLFKEIKAALLSVRSVLIEQNQKTAAVASDNIERLRYGNEEIHGNAASVAKASY